MKRSAAHQAAVDSANYQSRQSLAYHFALTANLQNTIQRVGSVYEEGDSYVWLIAFSPRMHDAVIVETFTSHDGQIQTRVFWLDSITDGLCHQSIGHQTLYSKAMSMQYKAWENAA